MTWAQWIDTVNESLISYWGLDPAFSANIALFCAYLAYYGLNPVITSGFRSPDKQEELRRRWEAGDPTIVYPPAKNSKHSRMRLNRPAAHAVDIKTSDPARAAGIALQLGIQAGYYFKTPDPVHFYI